MRRVSWSLLVAGLLALFTSAEGHGQEQDTMRLGGKAANLSADVDGDVNTELVYYRRGGFGFSLSFGSPYYGGGWGGYGYHRPYYGGWGGYGYHRPYYGGYGYHRPYYGGWGGYNYYRPHYYGSYYHRPYWHGSHYHHYRPSFSASFYYHRPYYHHYYPISYSTGSACGDSYPCYGESQTVTLSPGVVSSSFYQPAQPSGQVLQMPSADAAPAQPVPAQPMSPQPATPAQPQNGEGTYQYDGGPQAPLPMPGPDANPASAPRPMVPLDGKVASLPRQTWGFVSSAGDSELARLSWRPLPASRPQAASTPSSSPAPRYSFPAYGEQTVPSAKKR